MKKRSQKKGNEGHTHARTRTHTHTHAHTRAHTQTHGEDLDAGGTRLQVACNTLHNVLATNKLGLGAGFVAANDGGLIKKVVADDGKGKQRETKRNKRGLEEGAALKTIRQWVSARKEAPTALATHNSNESFKRPHSPANVRGFLVEGLVVKLDKVAPNFVGHIHVVCHGRCCCELLGRKKAGACVGERGQRKSADKRAELVALVGKRAEVKKAKRKEETKRRERETCAAMPLILHVSKLLPPLPKLPLRQFH